MTDALSRLLARLDALSSQPTPHELGAILRDPSLTDAELLDGMRPCCTWPRDGYSRNLVRASPHYQLFAMCWGPGQESSIHDHEGSACGLRVVRGDLTEIRYRKVSDRAATPSHAPAVFREGTVCVSYDADIHIVANRPTPDWPATEHMVSMHVYTPPLTDWNCYEEAPAAAAARR